MKQRRWLKISIALIIVLIVIDIVAGVFFYNLAIQRGQKDFLNDNADLEVSAEAMNTFTKGGWRQWVREQDFEELEVTSFDDLKLQGYLLEAEKPTNKLVIMAHGYLGNGSQMGLYGQYYYEELGYHFFTADARGHGSSEGDYYGFGWHDRLDYLKWIDLLINKLGPDTEIVLHGLSMGAATVLMTSGEELPENVKVVVADSPYTSVKDLFSYQITRMFHLPPFPVLDTTSLVSKIRAGYSFTEATALEQVKQVDLPILYIHGDADTFVPTEMTTELYENTPNAEMVTFENANHGEAFAISEEKYIEVLTTFLDKHFD
ncbi:alpha/beta hydrolase [Ornithinibacillus halophilus]|uniref:Peptidase S9 prolyl oligopeptidase catalytic domain-containing protein n=1 Tax=Ornithinibacillus halophilus TaxID=930117 RepID=A0A1M5LYK7_9BACI|nr:alpha/beta hydrolase [Ornithinibacillus halophilus]SHG70095.1 hypothetical protein SAMN05216225_10525 [Ornithinibacillus halophilus]